MARRITDALDPFNFVYVFQKECKVDFGSIGPLAAIRINVLSQKRDFLDALLGQNGAFDQDVHQGPADFFPAGIGDNAVRAIFAAAFHHRYKSGRAFHLWFRQTVEFFNLREGNVHLRLPRRLPLFQELRQAVQRLRPENHVYPRRAAKDIFPFLARNTPADGNPHARAEFLQFADAPQIGKRFFLRLFADGAGDDHDEIGVVRFSNAFVPLGAHEVDDARGVIVVHLAAEAAQVDFFSIG